MSMIHPYLDAILTNFSKNFEGEKEHQNYQKFENMVLNNGPLFETLNDATKNLSLQKITFLDTDIRAQALYNSATSRIEIREGAFANMVGLAGDLNHEANHAKNALVHKEAYSNFTEQVKAIASQDGLVHNYSDALKAIMDAERNSEIEAEVAGWNAAVSQIRIEKNLPVDAEVSLLDIYDNYLFGRVYLDDKTGSDGIRQYDVKQGITIDSSEMDLELSRERIGQLYYDQLPEQAAAGRYGDSDYQNLYAGRALSIINEQERALNPNLEHTMITIDMDALRLNERLLEQNGLDLGGAGNQLHYYDTSGLDWLRAQEPLDSSLIKEHAQEHTFDHTMDTYEHINNGPEAHKADERGHYGNPFPDFSQNPPQSLEPQQQMAEQSQALAALSEQMRDHEEAINTLGRLQGALYQDNIDLDVPIYPQVEDQFLAANIDLTAQIPEAELNGLSAEALLTVLEEQKKAHIDARHGLSEDHKALNADIAARAQTLQAAQEPEPTALTQAMPTEFAHNGKIHNGQHFKQMGADSPNYHNHDRSLVVRLNEDDRFEIFSIDRQKGELTPLATIEDFSKQSDITLHKHNERSVDWGIETERSQAQAQTMDRSC